MRNCKRYNRIYGLQLRNILLRQLICFVLRFFFLATFTFLV